jgi:phospholipase C
MRVRKLLARLSGALAVTMIAGGSAMAASTPIEHVVVIFQENVSFDHYFATYPVAKNIDGTSFSAAPGTPSVNGLTPALLSTGNPNWNGSLGQPFRLSFAEAATCDQDHNYMNEQQAFDNGLMDMFPAFTNVANCTPSSLNANHPNDLVMGYYDGNTTTALWNYAQNFAMNDNSFGTTFGPSAPGAVNLISGDTGGAIQDARSGDVTDGSLTNDAQPTGDTCTTRDSAHLTGSNIGNLLTSNNLTWGWFEGGFDLTITNTDPKTKVMTTGCARAHTSLTGAFPPKVDYIPHHEPFQFFASTVNPTHIRPSSVSAIGTNSDGGANHQYDSHDFFDALATGNLPNVVFLKAPGYQDGHAGYSSPLDEQIFVADTINQLEESKFWDSTAVIIAYDDSDGWYDHQMGPIMMHSQQLASGGSQGDALTGSGLCGGSSNGLQAQGRCGYGPRLPFLVISPWARTNFVDHTTTDQSSAIAFIEKNWGLSFVTPATPSDPGSYDQYAGPITNMFDFTQKKDEIAKHKVFINPATGEVLKKPTTTNDGD